MQAKPIALASVVALAALGATVAVYGQAHINQLSAGLLSLIIAVVSTGASFYFGRTSARAAAADVVEPHAKKAVRRVQNLAEGVQGFALVVATQRDLVQDMAQGADSAVPAIQVHRCFDMLDAQIASTLRTASDAVEDWADITPEVVEELKQALRQGQPEP